MANSKRDYISGVVLFIINLLNYVDRYTVAGVLNEVQEYFGIDDSMGGLIQTVFLIFFMVGSPVCGYLGDRYNRKWIIVVGVVIWIVAVLASSFVPADQFWMFLLFRGLVGIGEASYSNISPSLISDMFTGPARSRMYMLFYFAVPVGSGLGFVVGSNVSTALNDWRWGVRVTGFAGVVVTIIMILFVYEPERGGAEETAQKEDTEKTDSSYLKDLLSLVKIPTFVFCTLAYTALVFVTGTLTWWEPSIVGHLEAWNAGLNETNNPNKDTDDILNSPTTTLEPEWVSDMTTLGYDYTTMILENATEISSTKSMTQIKARIGLIFGGITTVAGLIGVTLGTLLSGWIISGMGPFRLIQTPRAQPIVSGTGALIGAPLLAIVFLFGHNNLVLLWCLLFILITSLSLNWGLNVDMLMTVIVPARRSTAFSYFMLVSHLFGDASGPYLVGIISDAIRGGKTTPKEQYWALVKASAMTVALLVISAVFYYLTAMFLVRDQKKFKEEMGQLEQERPESPDSLTELKQRNKEEDCNSVDSGDNRF